MKEVRKEGIMSDSGRHDTVRFYRSEKNLLGRIHEILTKIYFKV